jgi:hypothetical protein
VKLWVPEVPPPGAPFCTEKFCVPIEEEIFMLTVICIELFTVVLIIVIPDVTITVLTPLIKLVPVKITFRLVPCVPLVGEMPVKVGVELFTVCVHPDEVLGPYGASPEYTAFIE